MATEMKDKVEVTLTQVMKACIVMLPADRSDEFDHGAKWVTQQIMVQLCKLFEYEVGESKEGEVG